MIVGTLALGRFMTHVHTWWPRWVTAPAAFPYTDAWETMMTFIAQILMARKKLDCWIYWVAVDVVSIGLYFSRGVAFVGVLYIVFLGMAIQGYFVWRKTARSREPLAA